MPLPGAGVFGRNVAPVLEIKPDSPFVVFYGESAESQDAELKGKLVLHNPESMTVRGIRITLVGTRKVSWHLVNAVNPQPISQKTNFLVEQINLFPVQHKAHKISAGYHEWDFSFKLPSDLDQSVEGLPTNWVVYNLKATVDRGYMSKQLAASTHIRVIRTLGRDLLETMPMEQINEDIWANKVAYKITVPQKNYIVGTQVTADFVLIPLRKGVEISTIKMELIESRQLFADYGGRRISHQAEAQVAMIEGDMPENSAHTNPDAVDDADQLFDESHRFSMALPLPKSLKDCRQSVDTDHIRITHKLRLYVNLKNPEGHTSQLLVKNHIHLFISPNLPPNEDQSVVVDQHLLNQQAVQDEVNQNAPPTYGLHQLDELYNDIDPSGFMTPGGAHSLMNSGANTPFYAHSRTGSADDLTSLDAVANGHSTHNHGASALALHHRLQNLDTNDASSTLLQQSPHHTSGSNTPAHSAEASYFDLATQNYDMDALVRTPSYNTAVRTPARAVPVGARGGVRDGLPSYETAISRPGSPGRWSGSRGSTPSPPVGRVNVEGAGSGSGSGSGDGSALRTANAITTTATAITTTNATHSNSTSSTLLLPPSFSYSSSSPSSTPPTSRSNSATSTTSTTSTSATSFQSFTPPTPTTPTTNPTLPYSPPLSSLALLRQHPQHHTPAFAMSRVKLTPGSRVENFEGGRRIGIRRMLGLGVGT